MLNPASPIPPTTLAARFRARDAGRLKSGSLGREGSEHGIGDDPEIRHVALGELADGV